MRAVVTGTAVALLAACTFPDVDYADAGIGAAGGGKADAAAGGGGSPSTSGSTSTSTGGMCPVPTGCAMDAVGCAKHANDTHGACVAGCNSNHACILDCDKTQKTQLGVCLAVCDNCAALTCGSAQTNCRKLVGL